MKNKNPNRIKFYEFLNGNIGKDEFELWIYSTRELEHEFPADHYNDLISFPFKTGDSIEYIQKVVRLFFDYKEYETWRTMELLTEIQEDKIETILAARQLRKLYLEQLESLQRPLITSRLGIGFASILDEFPIEKEYEFWNPEALKHKIKIINHYKEDLVRTATLELIELKSNKVKSIDMSQVNNNEHLHYLFAEKLCFPQFYGNNWDAFWDAITGLVDMPNRLILYQWKTFQNKLPNDAMILKKLVENYNESNKTKQIDIKSGNRN